MITSLPLSLITDSSSKRGMENLEVVRAAIMAELEKEVTRFLESVPGV
jgi:hypothetical protein